MAIANLQTFRDALEQQRETVIQAYTTVSASAGRVYDMFTLAPSLVTPSTALVPDSATAGALRFSNPTSGQLSVVGARLSSQAVGGYIIADRLSHQGGLSAIVSGAQTTNLPTAALTRYTSGDGVMMGLTIYSILGTTATTVTASYTNSSGVAGRTTQAIAFGGSANREISRLLVLPLQDGDTGIRSVESVNVVATTGTAGNFGVTLFKPLFSLVLDSTSSTNPLIGFVNGNSGGGIPTIQNDACLFPIAMTLGSSLQATVSLQFAEN